MKPEHYFKDRLKRLQDNEIVWTRKDSEVTVLNFWKKLLLCESCGRETHLTSQSYPFYGPHHAVCEECYCELHAYHRAYVETRKTEEPLK